MRRVRWKRKDAFVQTCSKRKFGECGSQLFCSEICFLLRGTGGVRISFSLVHRADSHMKPRDANRTPSASFSAAAPHPQEGFPEARPVSFSQEGFPKGRAAARPFVSFQGGAGGNRNPPAFLFRGLGGHSLFKREYPPGFSVPKRYSSAGNPGNLFGKTKRKWGFNPVRHRRTSSHQSGAFDISKEK